MRKPFLACIFAVAFALPAAAAETVVGKLLNAELMRNEARKMLQLTIVVRVNNGSYVLINCAVADDAPATAVDLTEAHALMRAYIAGGSGTNVEATVTKSASSTGFPSYLLQSWKMPIPGLDDYAFSCVNGTG